MIYVLGPVTRVLVWTLTMHPVGVLGTKKYLCAPKAMSPWRKKNVYVHALGKVGPPHNSSRLNPRRRGSHMPPAIVEVEVKRRGQDRTHLTRLVNPTRSADIALRLR